MRLCFVSGTVLGPGENDIEQHGDLPFLPVAEQDVYIEALDLHRLPKFKTWITHLHTVWLGGNYSRAPCLSFVIYKMGITVPTSQRFVKALGKCLACNKFYLISISWGINVRKQMAQLREETQNY